jgi:glycosyltransferase involved in cell wall biosynthesis
VKKRDLHVGVEANGSPLPARPKAYAAARMSSRNAPPAVSIGLAVRNEPQGIRRCIESVLSQDFTDLELVICDNASDDSTVDTLEEYARDDRRVRVAVNPINVGIHENMNRVLRASRGTVFRWISADDWLEPYALSTGMRTLKRHPEAIGVTMGFTIHTPGVAPRYERFQGEFPSSPDAGRRFERMLWFFHAGDAKYDPAYGIYRRDQLMRTGRLRPSERTDWLMCAELALIGPIIHIDELLANRTRDYPVGVDRAGFRRRLDPFHGEKLKTSPARMYGDLDAIAQSAGLSESQLRRCRRALRRFWAHEAMRSSRMSLSDAVHRALPR